MSCSLTRDSKGLWTVHSITVVIFLLLILLGAPGLFAQEKSEKSKLKKRNSDDVSYRFLGSREKNERGTFGFDEIEEDAQLKVIPEETAEELRRREKIRNVLRLVEGDSVQITSGVRVKMIGVDAPEYKGEQGRRSYQIFAAQAKKWLKEFMESPFDAMGKYEGMDAQVNYTDDLGDEFVYYYLYMPDQLLEDIRKDELKEYDGWLKEKAAKMSKNIEEMKKNRAEITGMGIEDLESADRGRSGGTKEYVINEQQYFHENGNLKREEIMRDGRLMIMRKFDRQGNLIDEVFYDTRMRPMKSS